MAAEQTRLSRRADAHKEEVYCRRLGHHLGFDYCRRAEAGAPCPRAPECGHHRPALLEGLRGRLGPAGRQAGKLESILTIVARVRAAQGRDGLPG